MQLVGHDRISPAFRLRRDAIARGGDITTCESVKQAAIIHRRTVIDYRIIGPLGVALGRGRAFTPPPGYFVTPPGSFVLPVGCVVEPGGLVSPVGGFVSPVGGFVPPVGGLVSPVGGFRVSPLFGLPSPELPGRFGLPPPPYPGGNPTIGKYRPDADGLTRNWLSLIDWFVRARGLILRGSHDQALARERRKACDQRMLFHRSLEVDIHRHRECGRTRRHIQHLSRPHVARLLRILDQPETCTAFEDEQFVAPAARAFEDERRAGDRNADRARPDASAAGILRHPQENRTAAEINVAASLA